MHPAVTVAMTLLKLFLYYLAFVNIYSFLLFAYDKFQSTRSNSGRYRVREFKLCITALMGGWIGGFAAMELFRHKTSKASFQDKYRGAVAGNVVLMGVVGFQIARLMWPKEWTEFWTDER
ncbi:hypothetical protein HK102_011683 [Quaeritorhiza haematococci]|nr:hypothetical protein HK102_011683 [Quaeritorhiza haematococci]